jgi:hypothetical protein
MLREGLESPNAVRPFSVKWSLGVAVVVVAAVAVAASTASAHIERSSYWPDPAPDRSVNPPAGGKVPAYRGLYSALDRRPAGDTRIVCASGVPSQRRIRRIKRAIRSARRHHRSRATILGLRRHLRKARRSYRRKVRRHRSIERLQDSISRARAHGYHVRPSETRSLSRRQGRRLRTFNERLLKHCHYHSIQAAINRSHNNDRVVIMPGLYTEPKSRAAPTNDPKCANLKEQNDFGNGAVSYRYQVKCPNDQNLVAVTGRAPAGNPPQPPRDDRHGIPDLGRCVRCNLQIQGSGVGPDDVVVDAGRVQSGNHGPTRSKKDVVLRADRADGFVLANVTLRHAKEHALYILESDGYLAERFKVFWGDEYGVLTFVEDHGLMQDCEAAGSGDAALYPGSSADTGEQTTEGRRRLGQEIRRCDMHHSTLGYSGTNSNAVHLDHNNFYDNALGLSTDVITGSGHPGYPQDSDLIEHNNFFSNNFNVFSPSSDIKPSVEPVPVGSGTWVLGGNNDEYRYNRFWDNWRYGALLIAIPDGFVCGDNPVAAGNHQAGCNEGSFSTSFRNRYHHNVMGRDPRGRRDPNGTDFWWDQGGVTPPTANSGNCWFANTGKDGTAGSITSVPPGALLPSDCAHSPAPGGFTFGQNAEIGNCFVNYELETNATCPWYHAPAEPH